MDYATLAPGLPPSSRLGFGCGSVMGRVGKSQSLRAIAAALDVGVTHFDVARLYGYGEAESVLGEALRGRRDRVVIASKFGLEAPRAASVLRALKPLAQKAVGAIPGMRPLLRSAIGTHTRAPDRFSVGAASRSLDQSLAALGTDYLDILFLHDCRPEDLNDELLAFLEAQIVAGKIRAFGVATGIEAICGVSAERGDVPIYQFGNSVWARNAERLPPRGRRIVAHSPFRGADQVRAIVAAQPGRRRLAGGREAASQDVPALMLAYALSVGNVAVVLCSMLDPRHLQANVAVIERSDFTPGDVAAFADLVRQP